MKTSESRKIETNKYLESKGIPICEHLPLVENSQEVILRKPSEIATRIMILTGIIDTAFDEDRKEIVSWLKEINLWEGVSKFEKKYLTKKSLTKEDKITASWRTEAVNVLFWSLGMVEKLDESIEECDLTGNAGHSIPPSPGQSEHSWPVKVSHPRRMKVSHFWI